MSNIILLKFSKLVAEVLKTRCAMGKRLGVYLLKKFLGVLQKFQENINLCVCGLFVLIFSLSGVARCSKKYSVQVGASRRKNRGDRSLWAEKAARERFLSLGGAIQMFSQGKRNPQHLNCLIQTV